MIFMLLLPFSGKSQIGKSESYIRSHIESVADSALTGYENGKTIYLAYTKDGIYAYHIDNYYDKCVIILYTPLTDKQFSDKMSELSTDNYYKFDNNTWLSINPPSKTVVVLNKKTERIMFMTFLKD